MYTSLRSGTVLLHEEVAIMVDEATGGTQHPGHGREEAGTTSQEGDLESASTAEVPAPGAEGSDTATDDLETPGDEAPAGTPAIASGGVTLSALNPLVVGHLILHYEARDVTLVVDGPAALRILAMFQRRREGALGDAIDPQRSSAANGWFVLDLDQPMAMSWYPGIGGGARRTAVDPIPAAR